MKEPLKKTGFYGPKSETAAAHPRSKLRSIAFKNKKTTDFAAAYPLSLSGIFARQEGRVAHEPRDMFA
ncbi:MAG: hypothetical protein ACYDHX_09380 [Methanothrix sp.]